MDNLQTQLENLRTLQQSYDQIAKAAEAYNAGKVELAQNITAKGVDASASETLPKLAGKVAQISQVVREIQGGEMYSMQLAGGATQAISPLWNLYEVLAQLKNQYLVSSGGNYQGILLGRFYKGYASIELSLADAYITSDGAFYTAGTTHVWAAEDDDKLDRWVAYLFQSNNADFIIQTSSICPRDLYVGGRIGSITFYTNGRIGQIVCGLEEGDVIEKIIGLNTYTNPWQKDVVINGLETMPTNLKLGSNVENVILSGDNPRISTGGSILETGSNGNVQTFSAPDMTRIIYENYNGNSQFFRNVPVRIVDFSSLTNNLTEGGSAGSLLFNNGTEHYNLIDYRLGVMTNNISLTAWNPANVLNNVNLKAQLINNIKNHILARVSDRTGLSQLVFTVSTNMYNNIASEQIEWQGETMSLADAFLTKNWLLAGS